MLGKWLHTEPDVLILDEPTRGVDVGAKFEIYSLINTLAAGGKAVLFISSEMPELLGMCDRILVMHEGALIGELDATNASQEAIMSMIVGGDVAGAAAVGERDGPTPATGGPEAKPTRRASGEMRSTAVATSPPGAGEGGTADGGHGARGEGA